MLIRTSQSQQWVRWSKDDEWSEIKESYTRESVYFQHARKTLGSEEKKRQFDGIYKDFKFAGNLPKRRLHPQKINFDGG